MRRRTSTNGTLAMKIQAKVCEQDGGSQRRTESNVATTTHEHRLAAGVACVGPSPSTSHTLFSIGGVSTGPSLGHDSPALVPRTSPA